MADRTRPCIRGCSARDEHYATCSSFGPDGDDSCRGCAPAAAREGALICARCYRRLRGCIEDAADLVGHLRSIADPTKAGRISRSGGGSRPEVPAPVAADLVDASDDIVRTLREWALFVQFPGQGWRAEGLEAGAEAASAYDDAAGCVGVILDDFDRLVNRVEVVQLADAILTVHEGEPGWWSVADGLARWPLEDRSRWADLPCPACDCKTVRIIPKRHRSGRTRYECVSGVRVDGSACGWEADEVDEGGLFASLFVEPRTEVTPHDARWLTLAAAAREAGCVPATVKRWAESGEVTTDAGRYWRPDVVDAVARRTVSEEPELSYAPNQPNRTQEEK